MHLDINEDDRARIMDLAAESETPDRFNFNALVARVSWQIIIAVEKQEECEQEQRDREWP